MSVPVQPERLSIDLLGSFAVAHGQQRVPASAWRLRTAAMLVKLLALAPGYRLHREQIMDALWPENDADAARRNLRFTLYTARKTLAASGLPIDGILAREGESLVLGQPDSVITDVARFEAAMTRAWQTKQTEDFQTAAALYKGDLLPEDRYEDWIEERRNALRMSYLTLLGRLASALEADGDIPASIAILRQVLTLEPADEQTHTRLMRLYCLAGQRRQALAQYEQLSELLATEYAAVPDDETRNLALAIQAGDFPASGDVAALDRRLQANLSASPDLLQASPPTNLPTPLPALIGRERESAEVAQFLNTHRLLTLTGTGGIGKTRLAVEVARGMTGQFPDGVFWVELAPLRDPDLVLATIANTLAVRAEHDQPLLDALIARLQAKTTLLLLDNFEHLVEAAPVVTTLLTSCPSLRVLVTSRVRLRLRGEQQYPVSALDVPDAGLLQAGELVHNPAVQLFAERAREIDPRFRLTDETVPAVAAVCRRLEGLPLAIELAAARVEQMPPTLLLVHLERRLDVLVGGPRDLSDRQQTLRNTIGWSYDLLSTEDQQLFPQLTVFAGGWTVDAVAAVAQVGEDRALAGLDRLVEHHLVTRIVQADDTIRYSMLETIREFAQERSPASCESALAEQRHAQYFLGLSEAAEHRLNGPEQLVWLDRIDRDIDNLRGALSWASEHQRADTVLRLTSALSRFWRLRGRISEGRRWFDTGLAAGSTVEDAVRARALVDAGWLAAEQSDYAHAVALLDEGVALYRRLNHQSGIASALLILGISTAHQGDFQRADELLQQALAIFRLIGDQRSIAEVLNSLGIVMLEQADYERSNALFEESLSIRRAMGDDLGMAQVLNGLGLVAHAQGDLERARQLLSHSLELHRNAGNQEGAAIALINLGWAALDQDDVPQAVDAFKESLRMVRELEIPRVNAEALDGIAVAAVKQGELVRAVRLFGHVDALRRSISFSREAENDHYERSIAATRTQLDADAWSTAWDAGRALSEHEAIDDALASDRDR